MGRQKLGRKLLQTADIVLDGPTAARSYAFVRSKHCVLCMGVVSAFRKRKPVECKMVSLAEYVDSLSTSLRELVS